jgi:sulfur carrier protein
MRTAPGASSCEKHESRKNGGGGEKMVLTVTGTRKEYSSELTVAKLLEAEKVEMPLYVTVSVNDEFIKREAFETTFLKDSDSVEFLYFMGGGF